MNNRPYIGRFAPSPSGELHIGSLMSALTSYFDAKHNNGIWKLRIDDIDPERSKKIYSEKIIKILKEFFLDPDEIYFQTDHLDDYSSYIDQIPKEKTYFCECNRKKVGQLPHHDIGAIYDGQCLKKNIKHGALRIQMGKKNHSFKDLNLGEIKLDKKHVHDFIIKTKKHFAYVFCCVVDDYLQNITHVVRGNDLLYTSIQQIYLQNLCTFTNVNFFHHPILLSNKKKISKSNGVFKIHSENKRSILLKIMKYLNQPEPKQNFSYRNLLKFYIENWTPEKFPEDQFIHID